jgi:hypothetical protein
MWWFREAELIDEVARKVLYRHRIKKMDMFRNTKRQACSHARHHFYFACHKAGIKIAEIQRYCERYNYPIDHASIIYGIKKFKRLEEDILMTDINEKFKNKRKPISNGLNI